MAYLTHKKYLQKIKSLNMPYWNEGRRYRWDYMLPVIEYMKSIGAVNTLEMGTMRLPLNNTSYQFELKKSDIVTKRGKIQDLNNPPFGFKDNHFDCAVALQVFEHLDNQAETFKELCRISKNVVLSFPFKWNHGDSRHRGIDEKKIAEWTCNKKPDNVILIKDRIIYFWRTA